MGRLLVLVVLVVAAVWLVRRALRGPAPKPDIQAKPAVEGELVSCARCGMHLPRAEARAAGERLYCSEEHARLGPARGPQG
jgi:uncharacterized protein